MTQRDLVFFSYRHDDQGTQWLSLVLRWLEPYALGGSLAAWSDRDIRTGELWDSKIQAAIDRTRVAVLLVNHTFFGSSYICDKELPRLVEAARAGHLTLVSIPIGPCDVRLIERHGLGSFQFTHSPQSPLSAKLHHEREESLTEVAIKVYDALGAPAHVGGTAGAPVRLSEAVLPTGDLPKAETAELARLLDVPPLDDRHFVERPEELESLRTHLLSGAELVHGLTSTAAGIGLHGMGGMGKSVLAQALCRDPTVRAAFPGGIAWVALGQQPDLLTLQNRLLHLLDAKAAPAESSREARAALEAILQDRQTLIVIDDIWDARHFAAFDVVGPRGRLLLTTRDAAILTHVRARAHELRRLQHGLARQLLANWVGVEGSALPAECDLVIEETAGLPLALKLAGAQAAEGVSWTTLAAQLRQGRLRFLDHPYGSVYASLGRSVDHLEVSERDRYLELAVFPEDVAVPVVTVHRLWALAGLDAAQSERLLVRLSRRALLDLQGSDPDTHLSLHDLQHDFLRARCVDSHTLHARLLDAHAKAFALVNGPAGWAQMPPGELYLWPRLFAHLAAAGRRSELERAYFDLDFVRARLASVTRGDPPRADVAALLSDFTHIDAASQAHWVWRALRRSIHVLGRHPAQLELQLFGRLGRFEETSLQELAISAVQARQSDILIPTHVALDPPGAQGFVFEGHESTVHGVVLLPDGSRALSWSLDDTLRLWDLAQPESHQVLAGHEKSVRGALLLPDGRRALSWSEDHTLRLWDFEQPDSHQVFAGHESSVFGALLLRDGRRALSWSGESALRLWDFDQPGSHRLLCGHEDSVIDALLLPDSRYALSWSRDCTLRLWDFDQPGSHRTFSGHEDIVMGALLLPDGRRALSWSRDHTLRLWDLGQPGAHRLLSGHENKVHGALLLPDGRRVLSWSDDKTLRLWNLDQPSSNQQYVGHEGAVLGALLLPDGRRALSWSDDKTLRLWDLNRPDAHQVFSGHDDAVVGALLLPDGRRVLSWSDDKTLRLWNLDQFGSHQLLTEREVCVDHAVLLPDGRRALSWCDDAWSGHDTCRLRLWDLDLPDSHQLLLAHEASVDGALLVPDAPRALSWSDDKTLRLWNLDQPGSHRTFSGHDGYVIDALLLPDGRRALSWSRDNTIRLWDLDQPSSHEQFSGHKDYIRGVRLLPDARRMLSWSDDETLRLWNLDQPRVNQVFSGHDGRVIDALLMPDGRHVLSCSHDCTLRLWDLDQPASHQLFSGHEGSVVGALLLPDDLHMLSWSRDNTLRLWSIAEPGSYQLFSGHGKTVSGAVLLPDSKRALSWSDDMTLRLWDLSQPGLHQILSGHKERIRGALVLPDGRRALSWSNEATLRLWDLDQPGSHRLLSGHEDWIVGSLLLPDGRRALSWSGDKTVRLWDLNRLTETGVYYADSTIKTVVVDPDGLRTFVGDALGYVQALRIGTA